MCFLACGGHLGLRFSRPPGAGHGQGAKVSLESFASSGTGVMEMKLTELVPTSSINIETANVVSDARQTVKTKVRCEMKIHP